MGKLRGLLSSVALAGLFLSAGCGGASTRPFVGGPFPRPDAQLFATVTEAARSHGYILEEEDPARGRFSVEAHTTGSRGQSAHFIVQCYSPGWFQITAEGSAVRRQASTMSMSGDLYTEYRDFSIALVESVSPHTSSETP